MGVYNLTRGIRIRENFLDLLRKVRDRSQKPAFAAQTIKTVKGMCCLFFALALAYVSAETTSEQAVQNYRHTHWPALETWRLTLKSAGFSPCPLTQPCANVLKNHPSAFSDDEQIWLSADSLGVYLAKSHYENSSELWLRAPTKRVEAWKAIGSGLMGFEKLVKRFADFPKQIVKAGRKATYPIDPKEIRY